MQSKWFRAPARVNLIGEHTDYNDGLVLPMTTALYTHVRAVFRTDRHVRLASRTLGASARFDLDDLHQSGAPHWSDYARGVAAELEAAGVRLTGADLKIDSDIPLGAGLSSSAALELAVAHALLATTGESIAAAKLALLCQRAERRYAGVNCGIMDQYAVACARPGHALLLDCRTLDVTQVGIPGQFAFLLTDSGVRHRLPDGDYNSRAADCAAAVDIISAREPGVTSLRDLDLATLDRYRSDLGDLLFRRCRHVVTENERVVSAVAALEAAALEKFGELRGACHDSLRVDFEVSCPEIDSLVELADTIDGVYGSRMIGGGFGGCVLSATAAGDAEAVEDELRERYIENFGRQPWIHRVRPAEPAGELSQS